jgi:hypothetical protein
MLYAAYGSNMNMAQMSRRCPDAKVLDTGHILNWRLVFRNVADIEPAAGFRVPVAVWDISEDDEQALDAYEGAPTLYKQQSFFVALSSGKIVSAMAYKMNRTGYSKPSRPYFDIIREGYQDFGLNRVPLEEALLRASSHAPAHGSQASIV